MTTLAFVDLETTGLDPNVHDTWEVAMFVRDHPVRHWDGFWRWVLRAHGLYSASPDALRISRYYSRGEIFLDDATRALRENPPTLIAPEVTDREAPVEAVLTSAPHQARGDRLVPRMGPMTRNSAVMWIAALLEGATLVGNNVAFDARFLHRLLDRDGYCPAWDYRVVDVIALAAGWKQLPLPWRSEEVSRVCGVEPPEGDARHTGAGDALWAMALFDKVTGRPDAGLWLPGEPA